MQIVIQNGIVDLSGEPILKKVNIEINTESKIGIVGRNGCGKTTLLRLIAGELQISKDNPEANSNFMVSGKPTIGTLNQMAFKDNSVSLVDEIRSAYQNIIDMKIRLDELQLLMNNGDNSDAISEYTTLLDVFTNAGGFYFEKEYDEIIYPEIDSVPLKFAISKRNEWMVKQADYVIGYVCTHYGGAYKTLLYAHKHKKPYTNLNKGNFELY